jgi:type VI secretion system secreted protein VgrG
VSLLTARDNVEYVVGLDIGQLPAREVRGVEGLSRPSRFEVKLAPERPEALDLETLVGRPATLSIKRSGKSIWGGASRVMVLSISDVKVGLRRTAGRVDSELTLILESPIARLRHRVDMRVHRDVTVPQIVDRVLAPYRIHTSWNLGREMRVRPYTVQFRESDLDFVHRLLEDEGITYRCLDGSLDEDEAKHDLDAKMQFFDGPSAYEPLPYTERVPFAAASLLDREEETIASIEERAELTAGKVTLRDFSVDRPATDLVGSAKVSGPVSAAESYDWRGGFDRLGDGELRAKLRAEALAAHKERVVGRSDLTRLAPGLSFIVEGAPAGFDDAELVAVSVSHHFDTGHEGGGGGESARLSIDFEALPSDMPFRPLVVTPRPVVEGVLEGYVCGPADEDVHTDPMGRVKVRFPWDRKQDPGPDVSDWVPILQDNTGVSGALPRIGWEVLCAFAEGDPDRPVALGRLYNGKDPFPTELPAGKTKSALRSLTSPGRDGTNAIWFDDLAGNELISVRAEKDQKIVVENDRTEKVVRHERSIVEKNESNEVGQNRTSSVTSQHIAAVEKNQVIQVSGSHDLKIGSSSKEVVELDRTLLIGGSHLRKIGGLDQLTVTGTLKETIGGLVLEASLKNNEHTSGLISTLTVGGAVIEISGKEKKEQAELLRVETILGALKTHAKGVLSLKGKAKRKAKLASWKVLATLETLGFFAKKADSPPADAAEGAAAAAPAAPPPMTIELKGTGKMMAKELVLSVKGTQVTLSGSSIDIVSKGTVIFEGNDASLLAKGATLNS